MPLFVIQARWQITENAIHDEGLAICSDPNTPITFIDLDGKPYTGEIWNYNLYHTRPWSVFDESI